MSQHKIWKQHPEYPNYAGSPDGQIKNIETGQILKPYRNNTDNDRGYLKVKLKDRFGIWHPVYVHRFIFEVFYGNIPYKHDIHHINHDVADNSLNNLQCMLRLDHLQLHAAQRQDNS